MKITQEIMVYTYHDEPTSFGERFENEVNPLLLSIPKKSNSNP
jgi:hypothetical protein